MFTKMFSSGEKDDVKECVIKTNIFLVEDYITHSDYENYGLYKYQTLSADSEVYQHHFKGRENKILLSICRSQVMWFSQYKDLQREIR